MLAHLHQEYVPEEMIVYGESLGGPIATYVARKYSIPTLILESPLPSIATLIKTKYSFFSLLSFFFPEFDTIKYLKGFPGRTLLLHCKFDEVIPYQSISELVKYSTQHIQMDGTHNNPVIPWEEVSKFVEMKLIEMDPNE